MTIWVATSKYWIWLVGAGQVQCAWMSSIRLGVPCLVSWLSCWRFCSLSLPQHTVVLSMQCRYLNWSCTISFLYGFSSVQVIISEYRPYFIVLTCTEFSCTTSYLKRGGTGRWNFLFCYKVFSSPVTSPYGAGGCGGKKFLMILWFHKSVVTTLGQRFFGLTYCCVMWWSSLSASYTSAKDISYGHPTVVTYLMSILKYWVDLCLPLGL